MPTYTKWSGSDIGVYYEDKKVGECEGFLYNKERSGPAPIFTDMNPKERDYVIRGQLIFNPPTGEIPKDKDGYIKPLDVMVTVPNAYGGVDQFRFHVQLIAQDGKRLQQINPGTVYAWIEA